MRGTAVFTRPSKPIEMGSVKKNVAPFPTSLSTPISPDISSTSRREIERPRPAPPAALPALSWENGANNFFASSAEIPTPRSVTSMRTRWSTARATIETTLPAGENLIALERKFTTI